MTVAAPIASAAVAASDGLRSRTAAGGGFTVICQDAMKWLAAQPDGGLPNVVTGLPDADEVGLGENEADLGRYLKFFREAATLVLQKTSPRGYVIFTNTDRKVRGQWIDKSYHIQAAAAALGIPLRWHKIVLLRDPGSTHIQRPTYQHHLCFSRQGGPGEATPDVMFGEDATHRRSYKNASCPIPVQHAMAFLQLYAPVKAVIDPFVGRGTVLVEAQRAGLSGGVGVDIDPAQCRAAQEALRSL